MNQDADLILNSGTNRSIVANGVDILARFDFFEATIAAIGITVATQASTIADLAAIVESLRSTGAAERITSEAEISALRVTVTTQASTINNLAATVEGVRSTDAAERSKIMNNEAEIRNLAASLVGLSDSFFRHASTCAAHPCGCPTHPCR